MSASAAHRVLPTEDPPTSSTNPPCSAAAATLARTPDPAASASRGTYSALEEQRNGEWRYLEFLQVTSLITAEIFMREIPGGMRAR